MHLVYIDEVKYDPPQQLYHWLCALAFPEDSVKDADRRLTEVAESYFGTRILAHDNEFHAKDIVHGKGPYKGRPLDTRVELYKRLLDLISETERLGRIEVRIEPAKMVGSSYEDMAFMFLVEKVDDYMTQEKSIALLIADDDKEIAGTNVASLSGYKARGTDYQFGRAINRVVDTIHHTRSHHSRLLQLADIYVYTLAMVAGDCTKHPRSEIAAHARSKQNLLFPSKYKNWPTDQSWLAKT
jgi:hypothetical protein